MRHFIGRLVSKKVCWNKIVAIMCFVEWLNYCKSWFYMLHINTELVCVPLSWEFKILMKIYLATSVKFMGVYLYTYPLIYLAANYLRLPWKFHQANFKCFTAIHFHVPCKNRLLKLALSIKCWLLLAIWVGTLCAYSFEFSFFHIVFSINYWKYFFHTCTFVTFDQYTT